MALRNLVVAILICFHICTVQLAPLSQQNQTSEQHPSANEVPRPEERPEINLPYGNYVQEIMKYLEEDESFKKYLETAKEEDIGNGRMANQLRFVSHNIRNKLDEVKRRELNRLTSLARRMHELSNGMDRSALSRPLHVDSRNPHTFEVEDLMKLIRKTTEDLEEANRQRREEFKQYEMAKEYERRQKLSQMDEEHRRQAIKEHEETQKKHKDHPKLHHPGSRQQLEEVWEKGDNLPRDEFDPRTIFAYHDVNGDGVWSRDELGAMFVRELNKVYQPGDDMRERSEEMQRMEEHVMNETDTNKDGLIDREEFLAMVKRQDFERDPGWQGLDEQQVYDEREFDEYQKQHLPPGNQPLPPPVYVAPPNGYPPQGNQYGQMHPSQYQYQGQPPYQYQGGGYPQQYQMGQPPQFQGGQPQPNHQQFQQQQFQQQQFQQQNQYGNQQAQVQPGNPQTGQVAGGTTQQNNAVPVNQQQQSQNSATPESHDTGAKSPESVNSQSQQPPVMNNEIH